MTNEKKESSIAERLVLPADFYKKSREQIRESRDAMLRNLFRYHAPTPEQVPKYEAINEAALAFAKIIDEYCPGSADRTVAIRFVQQARMFANASIALRGQGYR